MISRNPTPRVSVEHEAMTTFCRNWRIAELALFGSILRDDFRPDSDVDVLVTFAHDAETTLFDLVRINDELEVLFGRPVDVVTRSAVERSRNPARRESILSTAEVIYAARP